MAIPTKIRQLAHDVRTKIYGRDVRESIAKSMEETGDISDNARQTSEDAVERVNIYKSQFDQSILKGDQPAEVQTLRVDSLTGKTYTTAADRFEDNQRDVQNRGFNALFPPVPLLPAIFDGNSDDQPRLQALFDLVSARGGGKVILPPGETLIKSLLTVPQGVHVEGSGFTESYPGNSSKRPTRIIKDSADLGIDILTSASIQNLILDGREGNLGDGLRLNGNSAKAENVIVTEMGGHGVVVGNTEEDGNRNAWTLINVKSLRNQKNGFHFDDFVKTGDGGPDVNGGMALKCNAWQNDGDGFFVNRVASNNFIACYSEGNKKKGFRIGKDARSNMFTGCHFEQNVENDFMFETASYNNLLITANPFDIIDNGGNVVIRNEGGSSQHLSINRGIAAGGKRVIQGLSSEFQSTSPSPGYVWNETDAPEGTKSWQLVANGGNLQLRIPKDDGTGPLTELSINRNAYGVRNFEFRKPIHAIEGVRYSKYKSIHEQPISANPIRVIEIFNTEGVSLGFMPVHAPINN